MRGTGHWGEPQTQGWETQWRWNQKVHFVGSFQRIEVIVPAVMHKGPGSSRSRPQLGDTHSSVPTLGPPVTLNLGTLQAGLRGPSSSRLTGPPGGTGAGSQWVSSGLAALMLLN